MTKINIDSAEAFFFRLQAAKCRRLASRAGQGARSVLNELSDRYEAEADRVLKVE